MRWRPALALLLLLVPSVVQAAHVHEHRYMIVGRVLDETGRPANFLPVLGELHDTPERVPSQVEETNCFGDFVIVLNARGLGSDASVRTTILRATETGEVDPLFRRTFMTITVDGTHGAPDCRDERRNFTQRHFVTGRLLEGGAPVEGEEVNVTIELGAGGTIAQRSKTNAAGDFAVGFQSSRFGEGDEVVMRAGPAEWRADLDHDFGITVADLDRPPARGFSGVAVVAGFFALAAAGVALYLFMQRRKG